MARDTRFTASIFCLLINRRRKRTGARDRCSTGQVGSNCCLFDGAVKHPQRCLKNVERDCRAAPKVEPKRHRSFKGLFFTVGQLNECDQARLSKNSYLDAQTPAAAAAFIRAAFFERVVCCQGCQISCKCSEHLFAQNSLIRPPPIPACTQQD